MVIFLSNVSHYQRVNQPGDHLPIPPRPRTSPAGHRHAALVGSGCAGAAGRHATLRLREAVVRHTDGPGGEVSCGNSLDE